MANATGMYQSALQRWIGRQKQAGQLYAGAEQPLQEATGMFRPGGGYGAGQVALIEEEAKRSRAESFAEQVATGMSSGSLATSTRLRSAADVTRAKLGVEDVRTQFLTQALSQLAGLRGTQAGQVGMAQEPSYGPAASAVTAERIEEGRLELERDRLALQRLISERQYRAATRQDPSTLPSQQMWQPKKEEKEEAPWSSMVW